MTTEYQLRVELRGGDIVVTCPGSGYRVVYYKPADQPQLMAKESGNNERARQPLRKGQPFRQFWMGWSFGLDVMGSRFRNPSTRDTAPAHSACAILAGATCLRHATVLGFHRERLGRPTESLIFPTGSY